MAEVQVREANAGDAEVLVSLLGQMGYPNASAQVAQRLDQYASTGGRVWVACAGGEVIGFLSFHTQACFHATETLGRITAMCVDGSRRRSGAGRELIRMMEKYAREVGCLRVEVTSGEHRSHEAHRFYEGNGYVRKSVRFVKSLE
ncbi:GNAT superfamily N-acetyltransferase [Haloferula luteola]|uniref:GNAT superfamily N-acetyltransferase n=1 Tax=Haloferula luteola TaxID=595692 RepID=A0A840VEN6_9BACT|nr:GNAT family N-acetyltransferase [Haloferula luteola]MBB5353098.1 GNAT superfamily N-acetyltransferase [Haloferula luteola]